MSISQQYTAHQNTQYQQKNSINSLRATKFIALGDLNAKHNYWGSRINNPKGKNFYQCIKINNLKIYTPERPTYWPSDPSKTPDILDISVTNTNLNIKTEELLDLSSAHTHNLYDRQKSDKRRKNKIDKLQYCSDS